MALAIYNLGLEVVERVALMRQPRGGPIPKLDGFGQQEWQTAIRRRTLAPPTNSGRIPQDPFFTPPPSEPPPDISTGPITPKIDVETAPENGIVVVTVPPEEEPFYKKGWFWGVAAGVVGLGGLVFVLARKRRE